MNDLPEKECKFEELRRKAEKILRARGGAQADSASLEMAKLIEELQVLQIELQLQNQELREASKRLEESQARYAELYHSAPIGYVTLDTQGTIVQANQAASDMVDVPIRRMIGLGFSKFLAYSDHNKYFELIRTQSQGGKIKHSAELKLIKAADVPFYVELTLGRSANEDGRLSGWRLVFSDISARKEAERKLQYSEEKYRSIYQAAKDAIIVADTGSGLILDANEHACELYGYSYDEMLRLKLYDLSAEPQDTRRAAKTEIGWIPVRYHKRKDDAIFPVEISASYITFDQRRLSTSVIRDITERLQKEQALQKSEEQLRYVSARLLTIQEEERQALATELHDHVTTPLSAIKYYAENLFEREDGTHKDNLRREQFDRMLGIIQEAMEVSQRMMTNLRPSVLDDFGIVTTLKWLCRQLRSGYDGMEVAVDIDAQEDDVPAGLKSTIFRIAQEGLQNAAKHSGSEHVRLALETSDDLLQLKIEDDGTGFDYKPGEFYQNGFGLLSMQERTELTGGSFFIESASGGGTTITATWPLQPAADDP